MKKSFILVLFVLLTAVNMLFIGALASTTVKAGLATCMAKCSACACAVSCSGDCSCTCMSGDQGCFAECSNGTADACVDLSSSCPPPPDEGPGPGSGGHCNDKWDPLCDLIDHP